MYVWKVSLFLSLILCVYVIIQLFFFLIQEDPIKRNQLSLQIWLRESDGNVKLWFTFRRWAVWKLQILSAFFADLSNLKPSR